MVYHRRKYHIMPFPSPSTGELCLKLERLASRHEQLKISYHELKSQIKAGLLEVEEVFTSLAIPLMKLVGLKTKEMAEEGRFNSIIIDNEFSHGGCEIGLESKSSDATRGGEQVHQIGPSEGENYAARATMAGKELIKKQHTNLLQLVHLLRRIEIHVNNHQDDILETLGMHRLSLHKFFQKAICCISALHGQNHDTYSITLKLLQAIFNNVNAVLSSVESGVGNLIQELAENMCNPMVKYVKGLKDDMKNGISVRLLAMVEEMERIMRNGKLELEDARNKVRVAEERKIEAICKLKAIEERVRSMKQCLFLSGPEAQRGRVDSREQSSPQKFLGMEEEQAKDDKLLWKLLKKKRKYQVQASPKGPGGLLWSKASNNHCVRPSFKNKRVKGNWTITLGPQTPFLNT